MPEMPANLPAQSYTNLGWRWDGMAVIHFGEGPSHQRSDSPVLSEGEGNCIPNGDAQPTDSKEPAKSLQLCRISF